MANKWPPPNQVPNPASDRAIKLGCKCPVDDNNDMPHGGDWPHGKWWVDERCEMHWKRDKETT